MDVVTKKIDEFTLFTKLPGSAVRTLVQLKDYYLVVSDYITKEEKTWAGTVQVNIEKEILSLIKIDDYWKSNGEFIAIKESIK